MTTFQKKKYLSALLTLILALSLLLSTGCSNRTTEPEQESASLSLVEEDTTEENTDSKEAGASSVSSLFNFSLYDSDITYSKKDIAVQKEFESYLSKVFAEQYAMSSITVNFLIENPENYGIARVPSAWPSADISSIETFYANETEWLNELNSFSYDSLTYEQKLIYDTLKTSLEDDARSKDFLLFSSPFSPNGITSQLPLIFTEYAFHKKEDVDEYLGLLETLKDYVQKELDYEHFRMEQGYYLSGYAYNTAISQCQTFLDQGDDYLTDIFANKLDEFEGLSDDEKAAYKKRNQDAIQNNVIPAYHLMIDTLTAYQKEGEYNKGLSTMENGKEYYSYLLKSETGTNKTPEELISLIDKNLESYIEELTALMTSNPEIYNKIQDPEYIYSDPDETLSYFTEKLKTDFPQPASTDYTLKETDDAMSDDLVVAFYILSPIDNFKNNIIYVNPEHISQGNDLFPTLAHEGLPGHMYQHNYFCSLNPHYFRHIMNFTGYSEAWAQYVELYSYDWSGMDADTAKAFKINALYSDALSCRIDLGINYEGWSLKDTKNYFSKLGINSAETAQTFYDTLISSPGVFSPYYVGYLELEELKETAEETLGDNFRLKDFHKFYLEIGPTYFEIIADRMEDWMKKIK